MLTSNSINMKTRIICLPMVLICIGLLSSCSVEKLVTTNNQLTSEIKSQNDSLILSTTSIDRGIEKIKYNSESPDLNSLSKVSFSNFYFGDIIKEEILDKIGNWTKIKLSEKIKLQNGEIVIKERIGWYQFSTPEIIYQSTSNLLYDTYFDDKTQIINKESYNFQKFVFTGKTDLLDQKGTDILLAEKALNFDGLRFDTKRFDYANLNLGSYRGTYFNNCNLSNIIAKRDLITNENDFFETKIEGGTNKDMFFSFWKLRDVIFYNTLIENSNFGNCLFSSEISGLVTFNTVTFKNTKFNNTIDGYFKNIAHNNTLFEGCRFDDIKFYGLIHFNTRYVACNFYNSLWQGVSFNNTQVTPSKITGGYFYKLKIVGGDYSKIKIENYGGIKPQFSEIEIVNAFFSNSTIDAWFKEGSQIYGIGDFSGINFTSSIIENSTFGKTNQVSLFKMKNCNFTNVEFRTPVKFIKCDLTGSTWPTNISNIEFINCVGNP